MQTPKETNHEIKTKTHTFSLFLILRLKNPVFLCRVKILYQQFLTLLSFITFSEAAVRKCSSK